MLAKSFSLPSLRTHWVAVALILSLAVNLAFVAGYYMRSSLATRLTRSPQERVRFIQEQLALTQPQQRAFARFLRQVNVATADLRESNEDVADQLWSELSSEHPDLGALTRYSDEINANRAAQQRQLLTVTLPFLDQLDPTQRAEFLRIVRAQPNPLTRVLRGN
jgi:hypothetical protein